MNQEQAKAWLPLIQAVSEGKTIQVRQRTITSTYGRMPDPSFTWVDYYLHFSNFLDGDVNDFRIKPEPKTKSFCIALMEDQGKYYPMICSSKNDLPCALKFIRWLADSIEYELPEGDA